MEGMIIYNSLKCILGYFKTLIKETCYLPITQEFPNLQQKAFFFLHKEYKSYGISMLQNTTWQNISKRMPKPI